MLNVSWHWKVHNVLLSQFLRCSLLSLWNACAFTTSETLDRCMVLLSPSCNQDTKWAEWRSVDMPTPSTRRLLWSLRCSASELVYLGQCWEKSWKYHQNSILNQWNYRKDGTWAILAKLPAFEKVFSFSWEYPVNKRFAGLVSMLVDQHEAIYQTQTSPPNKQGTAMIVTERSQDRTRNHATEKF